MIRFSLPLALGFLLGNAAVAVAFEDAKVMPAGVRRITLRVVTTSFTQKTDDRGRPQELEKPLEKGLTFADLLKAEANSVRRATTAGFLRYEGFSDSEPLGRFAGDLRGRVTVTAPVFAYGVTNRLTLALAVPIYSMQMGVNLGFQANDTGQRFLDTLALPYNNQGTAAREATGKINNAVGRLNRKLQDNDYRPIENWSATALGDMQMLAKARVVETRWLKGALTAGIVMPTGRTDSPDILIDKGFGDGQWDLLSALFADQPVGETGITANEFIRYTHQLPGKKTVRLVTGDEAIAVGRKSVRWKPGDKVDAGFSLQYEATWGVVGGAGFNHSRKSEDVFRSLPRGVDLEKDTAERQNQAEFEVGYSGIQAYRRGEIPIPFESRFNYRRQLSSRNVAVTDFFQVDTSIFF